MEKMNYVKGAICGVGAVLSAKLGLLYIVIPLLLVCMVADYLTGMLASKKEGTISSKIGRWGIVKKLMYMVEVAVGVIVDWTIINVAESLNITVPTTTFFGLLVALWIIFNELISILENLTRLETPMPTFLINIVKNFKVVVEKQGDNLENNICNTNKK